MRKTTWNKEGTFLSRTRHLLCNFNHETKKLLMMKIVPAVAQFPENASKYKTTYCGEYQPDNIV